MIKEICMPDWDRNWFKSMSEVVDLDKPIEVYRNLHKKCWSVRQAGKVVAHSPYILLRDAKFVVQPAGREKVLREQKKNVHAFVKGYLVNAKQANELITPIEWTQSAITYNPYEYPYFHLDGMKVTDATVVDMDLNGFDEPVLAWGKTLAARFAVSRKF